MPMSFPDLESLEFAAKVHKFRMMTPGERVEDYRKSLADHVRPIDLIESHEIRTGKGWDEWTSSEFRAMLAGRSESSDGNS